MGMVHKGGNAVPFHGDHHPVGIYVGSQPIFEPIDQAHDGKTLTFENTYNDVAEVTVFGDSTQETLTGKNLIDSENAGVWNNAKVWGDVTKSENSFVLTAGTKGATLYFYENITLVGGQSYTVSFDASSSVDNLMFGYHYLMSPNGETTNYPLMKNVVLTRETQHLSFRFAAPTGYGESFYSKFMLGSTDCSLGDTINLSNIQLEAGDAATEYEPYCGGIPSPNPDYPQPIKSIKSVELSSSNADGSNSATRTIDLQGHELRSLPDGTHDELLVHSDGTVELVQRCDESMFDPSYPISNGWKLSTPQTIQLPSIEPLPTYHPHTVVGGNGADISAHVRVFLGHDYKMIDDGGE